jgi:hydrogenase maturation protein HypF
LNGNKSFISQHIGDAENVETRGFLQAAAQHLVRLTNSSVEAVSCDLHPKFTTTRLAQDLAEENGWQLVRVQHHYAHIAGLMLECGAEEMVGICCDGYGYGPKGEAWGGEILLCSDRVFGFKRLGHLQEQPLIGGDLATRYPVRMAAGILHGKEDVQDWLLENSLHLPHGEEEVEIILRQLRKSRGITRTTSCGRILDALSAVLGVCFERTYEGEPSMKLESAAVGGKDVLKMPPLVKFNTLDTTQMLLQIFESRKKFSKKDLAFSAHSYLARGLASLAVKSASECGVKTVGFTGGVAYNEIFTSILRQAIEAEGLHFVVHQAVPAGDGGLSFGQAVASGFSQN